MGTVTTPETRYNQPAPRAGLLLRRLMIRCPVTGDATDTGFEITALPLISDTAHRLIDCLECGQDHEWTVDDLCLEESGFPNHVPGQCGRPRQEPRRFRLPHRSGLSGPSQPKWIDEPDLA